MRKFIIIIICVIFFPYLNSLFNDFVGDDGVVIVQNNFIKSKNNFPRLFNQSYLSEADNMLLRAYRKQDYGSGELSYRPVVTLSYMVDYFFWKLNPFGYHLSNMLLHMLNAILVYLLILFLVKDNILALITSLFFGIHPINSEVINCITFREDLLAVFFLLISFMLFINYAKHGGFKKNIIYAGSCLSLLLALFSKETAVVFILIIMLYDFYFEFNGDIKKSLLGFKTRYFGYLAVTLLYLVIYLFVFSSLDKMKAQLIGGGIYAHLLTCGVMLGRYLSDFFTPFNISIVAAFYSPLVKSILNYEALCYLMLLLLFIILGIRIYKYSKIASFGVFWFFITMFPTSNIVIPLVNKFAYRYMYLPGIGLCLVLAVACKALMQKNILRSAVPAMGKILVFSILGLYTVLTIPLNMFWKNDFTFYYNQVLYYPQTPAPYAAVGSYYFENGLYQQAVIYLRECIRLNSLDSRVYDILGIAYMKLKMYDQAISTLSKAVKLWPDNAEVHYSLGVVYMDKNETNEAIKYFNKAIEIDPQYPDAYNSLAVVYVNLGKNEEAVRLFFQALRFDPDNEMIKNNLKKLKESLRIEKSS